MDEWHLLETTGEPGADLTWRILTARAKSSRHVVSKSDVTCVCITNDAQIIIGFRNGMIRCLELAFDSAKAKSELVNLPARVPDAFQDAASGGSITHLRILYNYPRRRVELLVLRINGEMSLWSISSLPQLSSQRNREDSPQLIHRFSGHFNKALFHFPFAIQEKQRLLALIGADRKLRIWSLDRPDPLIDGASNAKALPPPSSATGPTASREAPRNETREVGTPISAFMLDEDISLDAPTLTWVPKIDVDPVKAQIRIAVAAETLREGSSSLEEDAWEEDEEDGEEVRNDVWALALFDGTDDAPLIFQ
jgi:hypothetical protein